MSDIDPIGLGSGGAVALPRANTGRAGTVKTPSAERVVFNRHEFDRILSVYGHKVIAGEWRDYSVDFTGEAAVFSVYRRTSEIPLYRIEKRPKLRARQGLYAVVAGSGLIVKRGHDLAQVLRVFEKKRFSLVKP